MDDRGWDDIVSDASLSRWDIVYRTHEDFGRQGNDSSRDFYSTLFGFNGVFMEWDWDISMQHGESKLSQRRNRLYKDRHDFAFDVIEDADGNAVCRATAEGNPSATGCLPLAIFGENTDQEAIDWVSGVAQSSNRNEQTIISGYISGELFELPAGFVNVGKRNYYTQQHFLKIFESNSLEITVNIENTNSKDAINGYNILTDILCFENGKIDLCDTFARDANL